jgi:ribosome-binding protein aMBF1 (putative translation factor)
VRKDLGAVLSKSQAGVFGPSRSLLPEVENRDAELLVLGRAVRQMREQRGITAAELADATGTHPQQIDALETGHLDPTYERLVALADGLGVEPAALVTLAKQLKEPNQP